MGGSSKAPGDEWTGVVANGQFDANFGERTPARIPPPGRRSTGDIPRCASTVGGAAARRISFEVPSLVSPTSLGKQGGGTEEIPGSIPTQSPRGAMHRGRGSFQSNNINDSGKSSTPRGLAGSAGASRQSSITSLSTPGATATSSGGATQPAFAASLVLQLAVPEGSATENAQDRSGSCERGLDGRASSRSRSSSSSRDSVCPAQRVLSSGSSTENSPMPSPRDAAQNGARLRCSRRGWSVPGLQEVTSACSNTPMPIYTNAMTVPAQRSRASSFSVAASAGPLAVMNPRSPNGVRSPISDSDHESPPSPSVRSRLNFPSKMKNLGRDFFQQDEEQDLLTDGAVTPAGSQRNSRRPSRIIDPSELQKAVDVSFDNVLTREKCRTENEVASREYTDDESVQGSIRASSRRGSFALTPRGSFRRASERSKNKYILEAANSGPTLEEQRRSVTKAMTSLRQIHHGVTATWVLTVIISAVIALEVAGLLMLSKVLQDWRLGAVAAVIAKPGSSNAPLLVAFLILLFYALVAGFGSAMLVVFVAPRAGGSGVPDLKAFLNGNMIPGLFSWRTWFSRSLGLVLVTSAGLFAGTEGPCSHLGAITSLGIAELVFDKFPTRLPSFGHRSSCEFVAQGCAIGVAAAFGAPVGGILFSLEEASSFWSKTLTWRSFVGSMIAAALAKVAKTGFKTLPIGGFIEFPDPSASFKMWELFVFVGIAASTGLLGCCFCFGVERAARARATFFGRYGPRRRNALKIVEVLLVSSLTMVICFWVPVIGGCRQLTEDVVIDSTLDSVGWYVGKQVRTVCPLGYYSDMGTLLLSPKEDAIKALFTQSFHGQATFGVGQLLVCSALIFFATIFTFGAAIPTGLFVPNILIGACLGRAVGEVVRSAGAEEVHVGVFALMGAVGMLAGFSRMTVSLTMIVVELTNSMRLLLPVMLVILISKGIADRFTESAYDIGILLHPLGHISVIQGELDEEDMPLLRLLTIHDACTVEVHTLKCVESTSHMMATLLQTQFSGFPLVSTPENQVVGLLLREKLVEALQAAGASENDSPMNLLPYADQTPEVKHWNTPLARAHRHFTAAGLRHLCVVDESHRLVGILTRSDLAHLSHPRTRLMALRTLLVRKRTALGEDSNADYCQSESEYSDAASAVPSLSADF
eukprot:TRINITY_DN30403_c0_g1_i1.p1 TRINITY_DN30403_c0_g1~~TRINITY_DN30403_c0_g1_i1.p1  ORF type:complete len:1154 (+),score=143.52 TRINITY_DN30403_c0_g1_i1:151-3612(+)